MRDEDVIAGFLSGEREALDAVDGWVARAASPYRRRLLAQWDDVLQAARAETTRLLREGKFRGESSLKTYLWQVVNHVCINHLRTLSRAPSVDLDSFAAPPVSSEISPLEQVVRKESERILLRVLEEMPAECRALWKMILEGLSYREMSLRQRIAEGALRVRVLRCRKKALAARDELFREGRGARV